MSDTMSKKQFIISGIGTDVGKTVASAIISQALNATYWKPVQAGDLDWSDTMKVDNWTDDKVIVLKEQFRLTAPMSPHAAATLDGVLITEDSFEIPQIEGNLIVEGAGGLMVPVNNEGLLYIDLFQSWNLPVILISRHYLGSINHTLLSIGVLKSRNIPIEGIVFVGEENKATESIILNTTGVHFIARIPLANEVNSTFIQDQSEVFKEYFQS